MFHWVHFATWRSPRVVAVVFAALTAGAVFLASRLRFEGDVTAILPPEDTALYREIVEAVGGQAELILLLEGDDPKALLAAARQYRESLSKVPNVRSVVFEPPTDAPLPEEFAPLLSPEAMKSEMKAAYDKYRSSPTNDSLHDPLGLRAKMAASAKDRFGGYKFDLSDDALFSLDRKALLVIVSGWERPHNLEAARATVEAARAVKVPVKVSMTGGYVVRVEVEKQVRWDLIGTSAISLVGVLLLFLLGFREWRSLLFASVPVVVGLTLTLGFTQIVYGHITAISVAFAAMVVGLGIDFPIQFYNRYRAVGHRGKAIIGLGWPLLFAALTTSAALWALIPSKLPAYREFGIVSGAGILLTLVSTVFLCPLLVPHRRPVIVSRFPLLRFGKAILPMTVLITIALGLFAARGVSLENDYLKVAGSLTVYQTQERIAERFGGTLDAVFFVSRTAGDAMKLERKLLDLVHRGIFSGTAPAERPLHIDEREFRDAFRQAATEAWSEHHPDKVRKLFLEYENWIAVRLNRPARPLLVSVGFLRDRLWLREKRAEVLEMIRATGAEFTGSASLTQALDERYRVDAKRSTIIAGIAVFLLVAIHLRGPLPILLACIPVVVGLVWTLGLMNLTGMKANPLSITVFLLVAGIGIDNGIHLVARTREIGATAASSELLRPMILTSGTTMLGFGTLLFASQGMLRAFGEVLMLGVGASLVAALFVLPPILRWWEK